MVHFEDLMLEIKTDTTPVKINDDIELQVRNYLPVDKKAEMIVYIVNSALDEETGCFSPVRTEVYFALGLCKWYADIEIDATMNPGDTYDKLETNGILQAIINAISEDEFEILKDLVMDTLNDIARYNSSAAGIIHSMSSKAQGLDGELTTILEKIQNAEGMETLAAIKDVVGSN